MEMWEIGLIIILLMLTAASLVSFIFAYRYKSGITQMSSSKGMNGKSGQTLNLTCPAGEKISFLNNNPTTTRGALICPSDRQCDPFFQPMVGQTKNFFNPSTTIDVLEQGSPISDLQKCEGLNTCTWTIPSSRDTRIPSTNCISQCSGDLEFIGTYDCIPQ